MTEKPSAVQRRRMNDRYRDVEPREPYKAAFQAVLRGEQISEDRRDVLLNMLYEQFPDDARDTPVDPWEPSLTQEEGNGLGKAVVRHDYKLTLHVSQKLYNQQPIGVLLRPINDEVRKAGEALITDVTPRSEDIESNVMPARHFKLSIEPLPLYLEKWVGDNGYDV